MLFYKDSYISAYLAGVSWLLYAYFFVIAKDATLSALFLTLGVAGALATMIHGGYDLANVINPPISLNPSLPSQVDPTNPILLYPILIEGFIVNPIWYLWLGYTFQKKLKQLSSVKRIISLLLKPFDLKFPEVYFAGGKLPLFLLRLGL